MYARQFEMFCRDYLAHVHPCIRQQFCRSASFISRSTRAYHSLLGTHQGPHGADWLKLCIITCTPYLANHPQLGLIPCSLYQACLPRKYTYPKVKKYNFTIILQAFPDLHAINLIVIIISPEEQIVQFPA